MRIGAMSEERRVKNTALITYRFLQNDEILAARGALQNQQDIDRKDHEHDKN
jgi:hypothetical protein